MPLSSTLPGPRGVNRANLESESEDVVRLYAKAYSKAPQHIIHSGTKSQVLDAIFEGRTHVPGLHTGNSFRRPLFERNLLNRHKIKYNDVMPGVNGELIKKPGSYRGFKPHRNTIARAARRHEAGLPINSDGQSTNDDPDNAEGDRNSAASVSSAQVGSSHRLSRQESEAQIPSMPIGASRRLKRCHAVIFDAPTQKITPAAPTLMDVNGMRVSQNDAGPSSSALSNHVEANNNHNLQHPSFPDVEQHLAPERNHGSHSPPPPPQGGNYEESGEAEEDPYPYSPSPEAPDLGFTPNEDLSNLRSALEDLPSAPDSNLLTADPEAPDLFDNSTSHTAPGDPDLIARNLLRQRFQTVVSNHYNLQQTLSDAVADSSQAVYDLAAIQDELRAEEDGLQKLLDNAFRMVRRRKDIINNVLEGGQSGSRHMWEKEWGQEWISDDDKEDELREMEKERKLRRQREKTRKEEGKGVEGSLKRAHDEEYLSTQDAQGLAERELKRIRIDPSSLENYEDAPRKLDKGKGRARPEDLEEPLQPSLRRAASLKPRRKFTPADRRDTDPVYAPQPRSNSAAPSQSPFAGYDDDSDNEEEDPVPSKIPVPPPVKFNQHDWDNELYQLLKYSHANSCSRTHGGWYEGARDRLEDADREPLSWLGYARMYGEDEVGGTHSNTKPWRDWDDIMFDVNPFTGWRLIS